MARGPLPEKSKYLDMRGRNISRTDVLSELNVNSRSSERWEIEFQQNKAETPMVITEDIPTIINLVKSVDQAVVHTTFMSKLMNIVSWIFYNFWEFVTRNIGICIFFIFSIACMTILIIYSRNMLLSKQDEVIDKLEQRLDNDRKIIENLAKEVDEAKLDRKEHLLLRKKYEEQEKRITDLEDQLKLAKINSHIQT